MNTALRVLPVPAPVAEGTNRSRRGANARKREATRTARRAEVRREAAGKVATLLPRSAIVLGLVAVLAVVAFGTRHFALQRGWIGLREVQVTGFSKVRLTEVVALVGGRRDMPLTEIDLAAVRARVAAHPWIADVSVRRSFPHRLEVVLVERTPVFALPDGRWVAGDGRVMDVRGTRELPVVSGVSDDGRHVSAGAQSVAGALGELGSAAPLLFGRLRDVRVERDGTLSARLDGFAPLLRVRPGDWKKEFARAILLEKELASEADRIAEIDLRYGSCAALRRREGGA